MQLTARFWLPLVLAATFLVGASPAFAQTETSGDQDAWQAARQEFDAVVTTSQACKSDSQCVWVETGCLLGCFVAVNRASSERVRDAAQAFFATVGMDCMRACIPLAPPRCIEKQCGPAPE